MKSRWSGGTRSNKHRRGAFRTGSLRRGTSRLGAGKGPLGDNVAAVLLVVAIFGLALSLIAWNHAIHRDTAAKPQYQAPLPARCVLVATGLKYAGHPVYRLTNASQGVLSHVTLMSWSEQAVPVVFVGTALPKNRGAWHPVAQTNINLSQGESLWLVGSFQVPYKLTVFWHEQSRSVYQVYTAKAQTRP